MKKLVLFVICVISSIILANAQSDTTLYIENYEYGSRIPICLDKYPTVGLYAENGCEGFHWIINDIIESWDNPLVIEGTGEGVWGIKYYGCDTINFVLIDFKESRVPNSFSHTAWKRSMDTLTLEAVGQDSVGWPFNYYTFLWSTGETTRTIDVVDDTIYNCEINDPCGPAIRNFDVQNNVELYRATVDLETKLNKVTWQTTPEQAEYVSEVKVERDGMVVGTAPYEQGYFLDNIGSENAARNYRLTAIATDGTDCPIPSYQKGTLHVDYSPNASNPNKLNMAWTPPFIEEGAPISVSYFQICKYDPVTDEVTVVDQLGANNTIGSYDVNLFDGGYATVAAVFSTGKDYEELSFSNLTDDILGVGENEGQQFRVYPNPANGVLFVETRHGTSLPGETYRIMNPIGQTVMQGEIMTEKQQIDVRNLPNGVYFITVGGAMRKFVVE